MERWEGGGGRREKGEEEGGVGKERLEEGRGGRRGGGEEDRGEKEDREGGGERGSIFGLHVILWLQYKPRMLWRLAPTTQDESS